MRKMMTSCGRATVASDSFRAECSPPLGDNTCERGYFHNARLLENICIYKRFATMMTQQSKILSNIFQFGCSVHAKISLSAQ